MPQKKSVIELTLRPDEQESQQQPQSDPFARIQAAILDRVVDTLNIEGLSEKILNGAAKMCASQVREEQLVQALLQRLGADMPEQLLTKVLDSLSTHGS